jgi:carboxymethylenebutenolidase
LQGAWAWRRTRKGAVLVIHENKGLNDRVRGVAGRFAGIGYSALAIDLLSAQGGTGTFTDPAQATAALSKIAPEEFVANLKSGVAELQRRTPGVKVAAVGFCMGGGLVWQLLAAGEPQLAAAVPFYGPLPDGADFSGSRVSVLGFYGAKDTRVTSTKDAAQRLSTRPGWSTNWSSSPTPITPSSTTRGALRSRGRRRCVAEGAGLVHQVRGLTPIHRTFR